MDEAELEDWFGQQREKFEEDFQKALLEKKEPVEKIKKRYDAQYRKLVKEYQLRLGHITKTQQKQEEMQKKLKKVQEERKEFKQKYRNWVNLRKKAFQKWLFDLKFRYTVLKK